MFCQNCGAPLDANASACAHCGQSVPARQPQNPPSAPNANPYAPPSPPYPQQGAYPPPYAAAPGTWPQQPAQPGMNIFAVLGFVLTLLPLVPFAGFVLSIIGWTQCNRTRERGKGFAVAGVLLNIVGFVLAIAGILLFAFVFSQNAGDILTADWYDGFAYTALFI